VAVSRNFYWFPSQLTLSDWPKTTYSNSPAKQPEVMTDLRKLPAATVEAEAELEGNEIVVHIANHSKALAFQLQAEVFDESGNLVSMLLWNDNYVELVPEESTVLSAARP